MYRQRYTYWSNSKLSLWIRNKAGLKNIKSGTLEEFDQQEVESSEKSPFIHWLTDTAFDKIQDIVYFPKDLYWNIKTAKVWKFFRNVWVFRKALYNYVSWDFSGLLHLMETATEDMSCRHRDHGHCVGNNKKAKELHIVSAVLHRIRTHDYYADKQAYVGGDLKAKTWKDLLGKLEQIPNTLPIVNVKGGRTITNNAIKNDLKYVTKIIERKLFGWWD